MFICIQDFTLHSKLKAIGSFLSTQRSDKSEMQTLSNLILKFFDDIVTVESRKLNILTISHGGKRDLLV